MARFTISIPDWYEQALDRLAKLRGINRATLAGQYLIDQIRAETAAHDHDLSATDLDNANDPEP